MTESSLSFKDQQFFYCFTVLKQIFQKQKSFFVFSYELFDSPLRFLFFLDLRQEQCQAFFMTNVKVHTLFKNSTLKNLFLGQTIFLYTKTAKNLGLSWLQNISKQFQLKLLFAGWDKIFYKGPVFLKFFDDTKDMSFLISKFFYGQIFNLFFSINLILSKQLG